MQSFMVSLVGLVLSVSVGAEPLLKGRVWLASGPPAAGVQVRLFDLTDLRRSVGTTTDEAGYFALPLAALGGHALPQGFVLGQNYPNPFNPSTIIPYQIPTTTHVRLEVFNLLGQRLATLVDGDRPAGAHTAQWDATDAAGRAVGAGVFIYRLTGGGHTVSRRMVLIDGQAGIPAGAAGPAPRQTAVGVQTEGSVYGLAVAGAGLIAYVDPAFRVGTDPVDVVLAQPGGKARMKVATGGILGDVNNDSQVDAFDAVYVALYSKDPSITLPNNGDIALGDVNGDGTVDLADGLLLALYTVNPSDPTLPPGIGQPIDGRGDDHGDTPSAATALAVGSSRSGQLETGGDVDYFRVAVAASGELTVHTTGSLDTKGQLEDSAGAVLARDDDGGDGYNFRLAHTVSAGTYYIKVEGYNASTTGRYTIHASGPVGDGGPVNIPDANLRAVIAEALGKAPNAPITPDEMATFISLGAADQGIRDLTGLEFATNLETLNLGGNDEGINSNDISNLSPLSGLTNLTWLYLHANRITDVSPLSGLTNLTQLWLHANNISDISPLSGLTNLTELTLDDNNISDISPLVANTGLGSGDEVYLYDNPLSSTSLNTHIPALESRGVTVHYNDGGGGDDHGDTPSAATALAVGSSRAGQLETGGDVDYFRVEVSASGDLTVHTTGSLDTKGQLEDSAGAVLARDDDGGDGYNFRIAHAVSAGTYYLKVEGYDATTTGSYTIHASGPSDGDGDLGSPIGIALDVAAGKMYWTDWSTASIQRANLDGSQVETLVSAGLEHPFRIALDVAAGKMYWTDWSTARIQRANLDGSQVETLVSTGLGSPIGIALDVAAGKMYWADIASARIQRANLDGSQVETLVDGLDSPDGIALDVAAGKMYWTTFASARIQRANLDGSQVETLVDGLDSPDGIALDVAAGKMYWTAFASARIQRANFDGSQVETLVSTGLEGPVGIALDVAAGKMYWTDWSTARIQRANLDGSQVETLVAKDPSSGSGDGDAISLSISGSLYPASDLLNRKRPVE